MNFDWKATLKSIAPAIGTALGGPMGGLAAKTLSQVLLGKDNASDDELAAAMQGANPDQLLELKQADQQFKLDLKKLDLDLDKLDTEDRASARTAQVKLAEAGSSSAWTAPLVSLVVTVGFFFMLYVIMTTETQINDVAYIMLGTLAGGFTQVLNYFLGSSKGSSDKTALIASKIPSGPK